MKVSSYRAARHCTKRRRRRRIDLNPSDSSDGGSAGYTVKTGGNAGYTFINGGGAVFIDINVNIPRGIILSLAVLFLMSHVTGQFHSFPGDILDPREVEPEFLAPLENITAAQGRDVSFTCVVNHLGPYRIAWIKSDTKTILAIHTHLVGQNPRLSVTHNGHNTWKLHVSNVQRNDSGTYMCQINTYPMRHQMGYLDVVIRPDILNNEDDEAGGVALEGGSVRLRCSATGVPEPTVMWRREDSRNIIIRHEGGREKQSVRTVDGESLLLSHIQRADMGSYLCIASNGVPPSVSKRFDVQVHFHPVIKVSNQLVGAPAGSDVIIQCHVEASPRVLNSWYRDSNEKIMPGTSKYIIEESTINEYALLMSLTVTNLHKNDFGGYVCASVNALGKAEGSVRLQELHLPKTTTPTPRREKTQLIDQSTKHRKKPNQSLSKVQHSGNKDRVSSKAGRTPRLELQEPWKDWIDDVEDGLYSTGSWLDTKTQGQQTILPGESRPSWIGQDSSSSRKHQDLILLIVLAGWYLLL